MTIRKHVGLQFRNCIVETAICTSAELTIFNPRRRHTEVTKHKKLLFEDNFEAKHYTKSEVQK
jgi:hypothetical protein